MALCGAVVFGCGKGPQLLRQPQAAFQVSLPWEYTCAGWRLEGWREPIEGRQCVSGTFHLPQNEFYVAWARVPAGTALAELLPALRASNLVFGVVPTENETTLGGEPAIELVSEHPISGYPDRPPIVIRNRYCVRRGWLYELGVTGTPGEAEEGRWQRVSSTFEFVELPPDGVGQ